MSGRRLDGRHVFERNNISYLITRARPDAKRFCELSFISKHVADGPGVLLIAVDLTTHVATDAGNGDIVIATSGRNPIQLATIKDSRIVPAPWELQLRVTRQGFPE